MNRCNLPHFITRLLSAVAFLASGITLRADPQLTSWFTANSGQYARIYTSTTNRTAGTSTPRGPGRLRQCMRA